MKTNPIILVLLIIVFPFALSGQTVNDFCGVGDYPFPNQSNIYNQSIDPEYLASISTPVVFNIFFWGINDDHGYSTDPFTENKALGLVARLNIAYNNNNIFFKYRGFDFINETDIYNNADGIEDIKAYALANNKFKADAFNMYIPLQFTTTGLTGEALYASTFSAVKASMLNTYIPAHEIGHNFNLLHTFYEYDESSCERVTRIISDPLYNANIAGDRITDTDACPTLSTGVNNDCVYFGTQTNYYNEDFNISEATVRTFMSHISVNSPCPNSFTVGQKVRIRTAINNPVFAPVTTTVESLYEPYKGTYYNVGPTLPEHIPQFQPGFEYRFVACNCNCPQPAPYGIPFTYNVANVLKYVSPNETNYATIFHPNHSAINIEEVDIAFQNIQVERCYDNFNRAPIGGSITRFNDAVFNNNITLTPQDSLGINNPNLINDLQQGLYKIEKVFIDGYNEETVIYKGNN